MPKIQLNCKQVLGFIIQGINNGNYEASKKLAQDFYDALEKQEQEEKKEGKKD